jgi:flap endonuclease-1
MGIKLDGIITRRKVTLRELEGSIIAMDAPNILYGLLNFSLKNSSFNNTNLIMDRTQRVISHLYGILYRVKFYYSQAILPIFCFDGRVSPLKREITKNQLNDFRYTERRYKNAIQGGNKSLARNIALSKEYLWPNVVQESKALLGGLGIPIINSPASAESQCAELVKQGIADYSNSQDYDSLLFGCPLLLQNLSKSKRRKLRGRWTYQRIDPLVTNLDKNLEVLEITQFQLVDLAFMLKTDYFDGIHGIGPKTALKFIKEYGTIEKVVKKENYNYNFSNLSPELIKKFRKLFLLPEVIETFDNLYWDPPNKQKVLKLLCHDHHLDPKRVGNNTDKLGENFFETLQYFQYERKKPKTVQKTLDMVL